MMNSHGTIGALMGMITLQAASESPTATALKAIAALLIGLLTTMLSNWLTKKFPGK